MSYTVTDEAEGTIQDELNVLGACIEGMFNLCSHDELPQRVACGLQNQLIRVEKTIKTALVLKKNNTGGKKRS